MTTKNRGEKRVLDEIAAGHRRTYVFAPHGSPPAGPCLICGRHPDKRHRVWDAVRDRFEAGESLDALADDFGYSRPEIEQWLRLALTDPYQTKVTTPTSAMK